MPEVSLWSGVTVRVQSAITAARDITAITKASPGVVTYDGADGDPAETNIILLEGIQGMTQVDNRVFEVDNLNISAESFELRGEGTSNYGTFSTGTYKIATLGTTLGTITGVTGAGGEAEQIDITTIHDEIRKVALGAKTAITYTMESIWDVSDVGLIALRAADIIKATRVIEIEFQNGHRFLFNGEVAASLTPTGTAQDKVITPVTLTLRGLGTSYTS